MVYHLLDDFLKKNIIKTQILLIRDIKAKEFREFREFRVKEIFYKNKAFRNKKIRIMNRLIKFFQNKHTCLGSLVG